ncbi:MAG: DUF6471 domain-containing protein [Pseudomonadota bacterium]|nr:DUF6471 domain-containing protein [Pseudomonadota bacterium]
MADSKNVVRGHLKATLAAARSGTGKHLNGKTLSWQECSDILKELDIEVSASSLSTRFSRGTFRMVEYVALMRIFGARFVDLTDLTIEGLDAAVRRVTGKRRSK